MKKQNLVIIHSFPTNSILLFGLTDFLKDYLNVYFINLPGFHPDVKPLKNITLPNFIKYAKKEIENLNLDSYWLAGISFGFLVANNIKLDKKCKGLLAIEPYENVQRLTLVDKPNLDSFFIRIIKYLMLNKGKISQFTYKEILHFMGAPSKFLNPILKTVDFRTFLSSAQILMEYKKEYKFHNKPYILIINPKDNAIDAPKITDGFRKNVKKLFILNTTAEHFPKDMSKKYFAKHITKQDIKNMLLFMNNS